MIVGIGLDLVEIARIEGAMRNPRFLQRILTERERASCVKPTQVAGRWAAKEAVAKALGISLSWQQVEILNDDHGKPIAKIDHPEIERYQVLVSITHERSHAAAVAVLERHS
jgi:holo-[acyl-carrier protein] synthase